MHGDIGGWMMLGMWLVWIVPMVIGCAVWFGARTRSGLDTALDVLEDKYARGEITRDQFYEAKKDLA